MNFPLTSYIPSTPVIDLLNMVALCADRPLLIWDEGQWTYAQFACLARRCASYLQDRKIQPGERVAIMARNSAERQVWQFGAWWIGAIEVSVNYHLKGELLRGTLEDADTSLIVLDQEFCSEVEKVYPNHPPVVDSRCLPQSPITDDRASDLDSTARKVNPGSRASLIYTSGTSGPSKGVLLPAGYCSAHGNSIRHVLDLHHDDIGYFVFPFFHVDFHVAFTAVIQSGSAVAIRRKFSASGFWHDVKTYRATWSWVVGFVLSAVMAQGIEPAQGHTIKRFLGAPIPDPAYDFFEDELGITILSMFGQTEADGPTFDTFERRKRGGAGWPSVGFDVEIHDESGRRLPPNQPGELVYRPRHPHMVMLGYWNRPDATVKVWRDLWARSGDQARIDEDGFVHFMGRMTDSIRRRGENVSAHEIESVLRNHHATAECVAVGVADDFSGEQEIKVFIVPEEGTEFDIGEFAEFCRDKLPRYAMPRFVELTVADNVVRSVGTGVVQKHRLLKAAEVENNPVFTIEN